MRFIQKVHLWASVLLAALILWLIVTGMLLHVRQEPGFEWIQPPSASGSEADRPALTPADLLEISRGVPEMRVEAWDDIARFDLRPGKGAVKVLSARAAHEIQVDIVTGEVLASAGRWSDRIEGWHNWSGFDLRLIVGLPGGLAYAVVGLTGLVLLWPSLRRETRRLAARLGGQTVAPRHQQPGLTAWSMRNHWWMSLIVLVPWTFVAVTGLVLQLRDELPIQAERVVGSAPAALPATGWPDALAAARSAEAGIGSWEDISRIYLYVDRGVYAVVTPGSVPTEVQVDAATAEVLTVFRHQKAVWEEIHGGDLSSLGLDTRAVFWLFTVAHLLSVLLWLTGVFFGLRRLGLSGTRPKTASPAVEPLRAE